MGSSIRWRTFYVGDHTFKSENWGPDAPNYHGEPQKCQRCEVAERKHSELVAEIKRLREALLEIISVTGWSLDLVVIARRALEGKK